MRKVIPKRTSLFEQFPQNKRRIPKSEDIHSENTPNMGEVQIGGEDTAHMVWELPNVNGKDLIRTEIQFQAFMMCKQKSEKKRHSRRGRRGRRRRIILFFLRIDIKTPKGEVLNNETKLMFLSDHPRKQ